MRTLPQNFPSHPFLPTPIAWAVSSPFPKTLEGGLTLTTGNAGANTGERTVSVTSNVGGGNGGGDDSPTDTEFEEGGINRMASAEGRYELISDAGGPERDWKENREESEEEDPRRDEGDLEERIGRGGLRDEVRSRWSTLGGDRVLALEDEADDEGKEGEEDPFSFAESTPSVSSPISTS